MRIIAKSTLRAFWRRHPDAEEPLLAWYREMEMYAPYKGTLYLQHTWKRTIINDADYR